MFDLGMQQKHWRSIAHETHLPRDLVFTTWLGSHALHLILTSRLFVPFLAGAGCPFCLLTRAQAAGDGYDAERPQQEAYGAADGGAAFYSGEHNARYQLAS